MTTPTPRGVLSALARACEQIPVDRRSTEWLSTEIDVIVRRLSLVRRQVREHRVVASLVMRSVLAASADEWRASSHQDLPRQCEWLRHRVEHLGPYMGLAPEDVLSVIRLARHAVPMVEAWWHLQAPVRSVRRQARQGGRT